MSRGGRARHASMFAAWAALAVTACERPAAPGPVHAPDPPAEVVTAPCDHKRAIVRALIAAGGACGGDADCMNLGPFCPFGCAVAASRAAGPAIAASFRHMEQRCTATMCRYRCGSEPVLARCVDGRCVSQVVAR